jgi:hypothetical protein
VEWTLGLNTGEAFRGGRTAVGALAGSEMPVAIRFPKTRNDEIESLKAGEQVVVSARLAEWNGLHDRGEFEVV